MSANNEYKRYFIILQEDDKGYEISPGKLPTGYVKIEVKNGRGKLNAFVQNVKVEGIDEYRLLIVAPGKKTAVDAGKIIVDSSGRGELYSEFESDNVLKSGMNISEFSVAAVSSGVSIPLSGYSGREKVEWRGKYDIINKPKSEAVPRIDKKIQIEEVQVPPPPIITQPVMEPEMEPVKAEPVNIPQPVQAPAEVNIPQPVQTPAPVNIPQPVNIPEPIKAPEPVNIPAPPKAEPVMEEPMAMKCPPIAPMEEPEDIECPPAAPKQQHHDYDYYYYEDDEGDSYEYPAHKHSTDKKHESHKQYSYVDSVMYSRMKRILRRLREYEPFEEERDIEWFKVGDDIYEINNVTIPYMGYMVPMGYPFMMESYGMMMDRKDFILGVKYGEADDEDRKKTINYVMFGIPAVYSKRNEAYYKSRGFMSFKPHKSRPYGYFIMCIDLRNGMFCNLS